MPNSPADELRINTIRFLSVDAVQKANSGHPGLPLGAAAFAYALWTRKLRFDPKVPAWPDRDRFVLSAGHGSMLLYSLLYLTGYDLTLEDLKAFRQLHSKTPGHPEATHTPGVEVTTGPLGQGITNAVGLAIAEAHLAAVYNRPGHTVVDHRTYCLASDGDLMEGVSQEVISIAGHLRLGKLTVLYDANQTSLAGPTDITFTDDQIARFDACGWHTQFVDIAHGNDCDTIDQSLQIAENNPDRPSFILVRTHIGYGSPRQDSFQAHGEPLGADNVKKTKEALGWPLEPDFYVPDEALKFFRDVGSKGGQLRAQWQERYDKWRGAFPDLAAQYERVARKELPANLPWPSFDAKNGAVATRDSGGAVMNAIAESLPELMGGSADLDPSTKTNLKGFGDFQPGSYGGRNVHYGVREHGMAGISNGLAAHGGVMPYCSTFFNFLDYLKPSLRLSALTKLHVIYVFTHDSVLLGEDGPTHQPIEHLAHLRALPDIIVVRPADALEVLETWKLCIDPKSGPWALVLSRQKLPFLGEREAPVSKGAYVIADSQRSAELILIATGSEVNVALDARKQLEADGTPTRVVSMPSWELYDRQPDSYKESVLPKSITRRISIEAAATLGWERYIGERGLAIGVDRFGLSAPGPEIAKEFGLTPDNVAALARRYLARQMEGSVR